MLDQEDVDGGQPVPGLEAKHWAQQGAINAGLAVFLYLDSITKGKYAVQPAYNQCDQAKTQ
jgi:hypothetical protein